MGAALGYFHCLAIEPGVQRRLAFQFFWSALKNESSMIDQNDSIRYFRDFLQNVSREQYCFAQSLNCLSYFENLIRVQSSSRFIHDQDIRFVEQYIGHAHTLSEASG